MTQRGPTDLIRRAGRAHPRTVTLAAASGAVLITALAIVAWRNHRPANAPVPGVATAPDIRDLSTLKGAAGSGPANAAIGKGKGFFAQYVDKNDRTRLAGEITADRSDPLPDRRYELTRPSAWFFQHDGRTIHIQADKGRFTAPAENAQPSDGMLEGSVRIRVFAATPAGDRPNLDATPPELDVRTTRVSVDWVLGQVDMPEDVRASSDRVEFHGRGLSVQFDPATQRLDQLHVASLAEPIVIKPAPQVAPATINPPDTTKTAAGTPPPTQPGTPDTVSAVPEERFYTLSASEGVEVRQGNRVAKADELLGWARTLGGSFTEPGGAERGPAGAVSGVAPTSPHTPDSSKPVSPPAQGSPTPQNAPSSESTTLFWKGPLLVQRVEQPPTELSRDSSIIELASHSGGVTLDDANAGLAAGGTHLRFATTREQVSFTGTDASPAWARMRGAGKASARAFEIDIPRAVVRIPGPGTLAADAAPAGTQAPSSGQAAPSTLAWTEQGEFQFDTLRSKSASLQRATLVGGVTGTQGTFTVNADSAIAEFSPPGGTTGATPQRSLLNAVHLVGRARAGDGKGGEFKADTVHVAFTPGASATGTPVAQRVEASGHAAATRGEESLTAGNIIVTLAAMPAKQDSAVNDSLLSGGAVEMLDATGGFAFKGKNSLASSGETLRVHAKSQSAHLEGSPGSVERQGSTLRCAVIDMDGDKGTILATGKGDFARTPPADAPASPSLTASWTRSMSINDTDGTLAIDGDARFRAVSGPAEDREDSRVRAETVRVAFDRVDKVANPPPAKDTPLASVGTGAQSRRVVSARGESTNPADPVRLEVRRGAADEAGAITGRTLYVEGPFIAAENATRTIHVAGAGKLLNSDRRPDLENTALPATGSRSTQEGSLPGSGKGDALFTWKQQATLDMSAGSANLEGGVRMVHRRLADSALTELECDHLLATIEEDLKTRRLSSVRAEGGVWARSQGREMTGQLAVYNAPLGILEATDPSGGDVLVSDPRSGEPLSAKAIRWDLAKGRIEIIDPGAISGPR